MEWARLTFAQRVRAPVPEPLAFDADGDWFGSPALAMTRIAGGPHLSPPDLDDWLRQVASALAGIHTADTSGADGPLRRPLRLEEWTPPTGLRSSPLIDRAIAAIRRHPVSGSAPSVLLHGDFHPGNTVWSRGRLSGIVDWSAARLGPRTYDLAYCRADLALLFGQFAAERLAHHYTAITGADVPDLPALDLRCALHARRWGARWLGAYRQQGRTDTARQFAARLTPFVRRALAELG